MTWRIRTETVEDFDAVRLVHDTAFGGTGEGRLVDALRAVGLARVSLVAALDAAIEPGLHRLESLCHSPHRLEGQGHPETRGVVGHVLFSAIEIVVDEAGSTAAGSGRGRVRAEPAAEWHGQDARRPGRLDHGQDARSLRLVLPALSLAPLAVRPGWQRRGIGAALVRAGLELCKTQGDERPRAGMPGLLQAECAQAGKPVPVTHHGKAGPAAVAVIVVGEPAYYRRFGFSSELARWCIPRRFGWFRLSLAACRGSRTPPAPLRSRLLV